ncbi:MAG: RNA polymerase sigma factor [Symbiobacteriia bacterium]
MSAQTQPLEDLVALAKRDPQCFGELYDLYFHKVYAFVYRRVSDRETAEDLTADAFVRALRNLPNFEGNLTNFPAWLFRIAANIITDHYRASRHRAAPLEIDQWADEEAGPEEMAMLHAQAEDVLRAVRCLTPDQQDVVLMRFVSGLKLKEIATATGRTEQAVKSLMFRALSTLRRRFEERGELVREGI